MLFFPLVFLGLTLKTYKNVSKTPPNTATQKNTPEHPPLKTPPDTPEKTSLIIEKNVSICL